MAKGQRWTEEDLQRHLGKLNAPASAKPVSKYRNVKVKIDGLTFDSKHEAQHYAELKLREKAGEITQLQIKAPFRTPDEMDMVLKLRQN